MSLITPETLKFLGDEEGCRLKAYQDVAGVWTIGYGMTMLHGRPVQPTDEITQSEADAQFKKTAQIFQASVERLVKVPLTPNQLSAIVSLAYNIGILAFASSTLRRKVNAKDYSGAADEFLRWTRAGSHKTILKPRRERERALYLK